MARQIDPAILSILAKVDTTGMKHTQKLDAFAKALGHKSQTACMAAGKAAKKAEAKKSKSPKAVTRADIEMEEADEAVAEHMHQKQAETAPAEERVNAKIQDLATSLLRLAMPRPRDLPGEPVWAEMRSDDGIVEVSVDVRPFLAKMTLSDYAGLRGEGFGPGNASDAAFYAMEKTDADAAGLSAYLAAVNGGRVEVGFSVRIDAEAAEAWVADHRPGL